MGGTLFDELKVTDRSIAGTQPTDLEEDGWNSQSQLEGLAGEVADILVRRLGTATQGAEIVKLLNIVFLDVNEASELLRVKERTIYSWISQERIPVRYANGKPLFLLAELLQWTLPEKDKHAKHRLAVATQCRIAASRLAAIRERG